MQTATKTPSHFAGKSGRDRGMALANRIHSTGQAVVWSGHREQAELYWAQLEGHGLTMAPLEQ